MRQLPASTRTLTALGTGAQAAPTLKQGTDKHGQRAACSREWSTLAEEKPARAAHHASRVGNALHVCRMKPDGTTGLATLPGNNARNSGPTHTHAFPGSDRHFVQQISPVSACKRGSSEQILTVGTQSKCGPVWGPNTAWAQKSAWKTFFSVVGTGTTALVLTTDFTCGWADRASMPQPVVTAWGS